MSEIQLIPVELKVGKETKDVIDVIKNLIMDIKEGKKIEALTENIGGIMAAVEGYDMIDDEVKGKAMAGTAGYLVAEITAALTYKPEIQPEG